MVDGTLDEDFATYFYHVSSPSSRSRIQRLRVDESFRVPKVSGANYPGEGSPEESALQKTILFRPMRLPEAEFAYDDNALVGVMEEFVDSSGSLVAGWTKWFEHQSVLADRFVELQKQARKLFVLDDIDVSLGDDVAVGGRGGVEAVLRRC